MPDWDTLFDSVRRSPFSDDPNRIPQEIGAQGGNIGAMGWLEDGSVTADVIRANAVIASKIQAGAIETDKLAANAVTAAKIAANTITANEIAANTITASEIAANTITASEIAADSITTNELAANAVITENILAANVTSSRIELTVSGKNFGANKGSTTAPGVFFDASSDIGLTMNSTNTDIILTAGGGVSDPYFQVGPNVGGAMLGQAGDLFPGTDNSFSLGISAARWLDVWAVDGTINTSDERLKKDIADEPLGLEFINLLRPRVYRWRDTADTQARESTSLDSDALAAEVAPHVEKIEYVRALQGRGEISDEEAERRVAKCRTTLGKIKRRYLAPIQKARSARRPGRRLHHGLVAQEVESALATAGVDPKDAAFWKQDANGEQALAYSELIAPLILAVQELTARVVELEGTTADRTGETTPRGRDT